MSAPFDPPTLWVASLSKSGADSLRNSIESFCLDSIPHVFSSENALALRSPEQLHAVLDNQDSRVLFNAACILDLTSQNSPFSFDPRTRRHLMAAEFILRYPEIYWIFIVNEIPTIDDAVLQSMGLRRELLKEHFVPMLQIPRLAPLLQRHGAGFRTLFDPTGLRHAVLCAAHRVRTESNVTPHGLPDTSDSPSRQRHAVSIEDEVNYALLNGYLLYKSSAPGADRRCGTYLVTTNAEYTHLKEIVVTLAGSDSPDQCLPEQWHVIEDAELSFADCDEKDEKDNHLMPFGTEPDGVKRMVNMLDARCRAIPVITAAATRTIVSTVRIDSGVLSHPQSQKVRCELKPHRGFYDSHLDPLAPSPWFKRLTAWGTKFGSNILTSPVLFHLSRLFSREPQGIDIATRPGHSAPGMLEEIATHLLRRCKRNADSITTADHAIQMAVLADVSTQLLDHQTPHLFLDALGMRHHMEVEAECMFIGTSNSLDVKPRLNDLEAEVERTVRYHNRDFSNRFWKRKQQVCNAMLEICADLRDVYQKHDQRDEEDELLKAFRQWRRRAYINGPRDWTTGDQARNTGLSRSLMGLLNWARAAFRSVWSILWGYMNVVLSSWFHLAFVSAVWIFIFALSYQSLATRTPMSTLDVARNYEHLGIGLKDWTIQSGAAFVGLQQHLEGADWADGLAGEIEYWCDIADGKSDTSRTFTRAQQNIARAKVLTLRPILRQWWEYYLFEMLLGYVHAGALIYLILQKFGRK